MLKRVLIWGRYKILPTLFAWSPVFHCELRVELVKVVSPPHGLLVQGADGRVGQLVAAANHVLNLALAVGLDVALRSELDQIVADVSSFPNHSPHLWNVFSPDAPQVLPADPELGPCGIPKKVVIAELTLGAGTHLAAVATVGRNT